MKTIKELSELYKAINAKNDDHMLDPQHTVQKHLDPSGNGDDVFKASKIKQAKRKSSAEDHGYNHGQDKAAYEKNNKQPVMHKEDREVSPALKAAQKNLAKISSGQMKKEIDSGLHKKVLHKTWKQKEADWARSAKKDADYHKEKHDYHLEKHKEFNDMEHDAKAGNLGLDKHQLDGALEEIGHMRAKNLGKMVYHGNMHHKHRLDYEDLSGKKYNKKLNKLDESVINTHHKSIKPEPNNKESIVDSFYKNFIETRVNPLSEEDILNKNISMLSVRSASMLLDLYESLDEDNKKIMIEMTESEEGINSLIDFIVSGE